VLRKIDGSDRRQIQLQVGGQRGAAHVRIKGRLKRYRTGDVALKGIDLDVPDGQVMALIGPSGRRQSDRDPLHQRLVEPTAGRVTLNDIGNYHAQPRRTAPARGGPWA